MKKRGHDFFLVLWICINVGFLYQVTDGRRCYTSEGYSCCTHFYENAEKECIECTIGYTSENGSTCFKCPQPYYGFHCTHKCSCIDDQICDHIIGCTGSASNGGNCPIGTFSDTDQTCKKCPIGFYGKNCIEECICRDNKRCDNIHGCIESTFCTSGKDCPIGTFSDTDQTCKKCPIGFYGKNCIEECICRDNKRCDNIHGCIESTFCTSGKGKDDIGKVPFYAGGAGLLLVGIFIGMLLTVVKNKCCSRQQRVSEQRDDKRQYLAKESIEMNRYEYIDEELLTHQHQGTVPPSLPVLRKAGQHQYKKAYDNSCTDVVDGQNGNRIEDEGYLNPYQPIQQANIYQHEYRAIDAKITKNKQIDEYLHPYNSLVKHDVSEGHEYKDLRNANIK